MRDNSKLDVVIVGGGPAGLAAALALGRARKHILLCDAGARRNAAAEHIHNFVTRDGTPPDEFRQVGRSQLAAYPSVAVRDVAVAAIRGERGAFEVELATGSVQARRVLLCTGMVDDMVDIDGFRDLWGHAIFQCPYCHAWEHQDQIFGVLAHTPELIDFSLLLRAWTRDVLLFTDGRCEVTPESADRLQRAGIRVDERPVSRLVGASGRLERIELRGGDAVRVDVLFARPPQRQVALVSRLGLELEPSGMLHVHDMHRETSRPGIYAAGDLVGMPHGAILAASSGMLAAAMLNHELTTELATAGTLD